jgi:hypothetical protein
MKKNAARVCIEPLETRIAPATLFVDNAADLIITTDIGAVGLSTGDTVTWDPGAGSAHGAAVTGLIFGTTAFSTIASAITASIPNDQIKVGPGSFNETLTVNKALDIRGNQFNVDATTRTGQDETVVTSSGAAFTLSASNIRINGFAIQGSGSSSIGIAMNSALSGVSISNNIISGHNIGLRLNTFGGAGVSSVFQNLFRDNDSTSSSVGLESNLRLEDVTISGNVFDGVHDSAGIDLSFDTGSGRNVVIERNTLIGFAPANATGIRITSDVPATSQITVRNNFINGWFNGVSTNVILDGITVRGNHLEGNTSSALSSFLSGSIDAGFNFYGPTDAAAVDALVSDGFDFLPFLIDGTDADLATRGFQPVLKATLVNETTATYADPDGDLVTVKVSKGTLSDADFRFDLPERGDGFILAELLLSDDGTEFDKANITITAKRTAAGGDGFALIQEIDATGVDLGNVKVRGDLGTLLAGDADRTTTAAGRVEIASATTATGRSPLFRFDGPVTAFICRGDFRGALQVMGDADGDLGSLFVGGTAAAPNDIFTFGGRFDISGDLTSATIRGDLGGTGGGGALQVSGKLGKLTVGGSLIGGDDLNTGYVRVTGDVGSIKITGSLIGGTDFNTGAIQITGNSGPITVGGSLVGGQALTGSAFNSGQIEVSGRVAALTVRGSVLGGHQVDNNSIFDSGIIDVGGVGKIFIGGDLIGGDDFSSGRILSRGDVGSLTILGSVLGGGQESVNEATGGITILGRIGALTIGHDVRSDVTDQNGNQITLLPVVISVTGKASPATQSEAVAVKRLTIGGTVENAQILLGFSGTAPVNPDAAAGPILVKGGWIAASLAAGVDPGADEFFGTNDDAPATPGTGFSDDPAILARVARLTVLGAVTGSASGIGGFSGNFSGDHYGFVAEIFGPVKLGGLSLPLTAAAENLLAAPTLDLRLREV